MEIVRLARSVGSIILGIAFLALSIGAIVVLAGWINAHVSIGIS